MKISKSMQKALNGQINAEWYSAYMYQSMAAYLEANNFKGMARWMQMQAKEEIEHGMKFYNFIFERGGEVELGAIAKPPSTWKDPLDLFEAAYKHELHVTDLIHKLVDKADKEGDKATHVMLHWFISEQVEEEDQTLEIVELLKKAKSSFNALMQIDSKLGSRKDD